MTEQDGEKLVRVSDLRQAAKEVADENIFSLVAGLAILAAGVIPKVDKPAVREFLYAHFADTGLLRVLSENQNIIIPALLITGVVLTTRSFISFKASSIVCDVAQRVEKKAVNNS